MCIFHLIAGQIHILLPQQQQYCFKTDHHRASSEHLRMFHPTSEGSECQHDKNRLEVGFYITV